MATPSRTIVAGLLSASLAVPTAALAVPPPVPAVPAAPGAMTPDVPSLPTRLAQPQRRGDKRKKKQKKGKPKRGQLSPEERQQLEEAVGRKMDTFITVELSSQLGLSDDKALKLSRLLRERREAKQAARQQARTEYEALQQLLDSGAGDSALKAQTQKVINAAQRAEAPPDLLEATRSFLTPKEQARLVLVLPHVRREMRMMMKQARKELRQRRRGARRGGPDGPGGFEGMEEDF